ncbi:ATP-binding cassette domain-containing protein [Companilactobacillus sp. DQM5]|uniref:ATP-binding cassette domain-containing protein n=1 Tax=Companilactobacillus sp. DQM5 TaxID=3463359 RepID=UPI004059D309
MENDYAIEINELTKNFDQQTVVDHISLNIKRGEVFGLLGPNGAGKTTMLRMMTTLLKPTSGSIHILSHDVKKDPQLIRSTFGLTGQYASVDEDLSAHENLMIFSRLNGLSRIESKKRTAELLEEFSLVKSADKSVLNFSGGMRRRLDLAISLITQPPLIFLDEPTTGLDPRTRTQMWTTIKTLTAKGSTVILTTQYLEEADKLADRIAVIDHGKLISTGTPTELKSKVGGTKFKIEIKNDKKIILATDIIKRNLSAIPQIDHNTIKTTFNNLKLVGSTLESLTKNGISITSMSISQPSMDDVFFSLTVGKN